MNEEDKDLYEYCNELAERIDSLARAIIDIDRKMDILKRQIGFIKHYENKE